MTDNDWKPGDLVTHVTSDRVMVVSSVFRETRVECTWLDALGQPQFYAFLPSELRRSKVPRFEYSKAVRLV